MPYLCTIFIIECNFPLGDFFYQLHNTCAHLNSIYLKLVSGDLRPDVVVPKLAFDRRPCARAICPTVEFTLITI
jgi:hypothetical protein